MNEGSIAPSFPLSRSPHLPHKPARHSGVEKSEEEDVAVLVRSDAINDLLEGLGNSLQLLSFIAQEAHFTAT